MTSAPPIQVQGIDHINMAVRDLDRSIDFYRDTFGFDIREDGRGRTQAPFVILGLGQRVFLALHLEARTALPDQPFIGHWGFVVGDIDAVRQRLQELNVVWLYPERNDGLIVYPQSRSTYICDPDGHEIELTEKFGGGL